MLETSEIDLEDETNFEITSTAIDDVFMSSPEKVEIKIPLPKDGAEILPDEGKPVFIISVFIYIDNCVCIFTIQDLFSTDSSALQYLWEQGQMQ